MAEGKAEGKGLLIKDESGELYYLRPEILEVFRVSPKDVESSPQFREFAGHISGLQEFAGASVPSYVADQASVLGAVQIEQRIAPDIQELLDKLQDLAASTTMCP